MELGRDFFHTSYNSRQVYDLLGSSGRLSMYLSMTVWASTGAVLFVICLSPQINKNEQAKTIERVGERKIQAVCYNFAILHF